MSSKTLLLTLLALAWILGLASILMYVGISGPFLLLGENLSLTLFSIGTVLYLITWLATMVHQAKQIDSNRVYIAWVISTCVIGLVPGFGVPIGCSVIMIVYWLSRPSPASGTTP